MSTMHPHNYQHDHSRETDELVDEFKAIFRRVRRGASETLRAQRARHARADRDRRSAERDDRIAAREADRAQRDTASGASEKPRIQVTDPETAVGISEDLIARWAAAHAVADLFREEADAAEARAAQSRDSSAAAEAARSHADAETARAWATAWDERVRAAGMDPDVLTEDRDTDRDRDIARPGSSPAAPAQEVLGAPEFIAEPAAFSADTGTDAEDYIQRLSERSGQMALEAADDLDAGVGDWGPPPSLGELIDATHPPQGTTLTPAADTPALSPDTAPDLAAVADLDAGAAL